MSTTTSVGEMPFEESRLFMSDDLGIPMDILDDIDEKLSICADLLDVYELGQFKPIEFYHCINDEKWIDDNIVHLESLVLYTSYVQTKLLHGEAVSMEILRRFSLKDFNRFRQRSANRFRLAMKKAKLQFLTEQQEMLKVEQRIQDVRSTTASIIAQSVADENASLVGSEISIRTDKTGKLDHTPGNDTIRKEARRLIRADDERRNGPGGRSNATSVVSTLANRPQSFSHLYHPESIRKRHTISRKITFSGKANETWKPFQKLITAHMAGENCAYMLQPRFLECYQTHGRRAIDVFIDPSTHQLIPISAAQFDADIKYLYSTLQSTFRSEDIAYITDAFEDTEDGILTWIDALNEFGEKENKEVNRTLYTSKLHNMHFNRNYKGGLAQFVADHRSVFSKLASNGRKYADADKIEAIYANLQHTELGQNLVRTCRVDPNTNTFPEVCAFLRKTANETNHYAEANSRTHARFSQPEDSDLAVNHDGYSAMMAVPDDEMTVILQAVASNDRKYFMEGRDLQSLSPDGRRLFLDMRRRLLSLEFQDRGKTPPSSMPSPTSNVPRQYGNRHSGNTLVRGGEQDTKVPQTQFQQHHVSSNKDTAPDTSVSANVGLQQDVLDSDDESSDDDQDIAAAFQATMRQMKNNYSSLNMCVMTGDYEPTDMKTTDVYWKAHLAFSKGKEEEHFVVSDGGAMTNILGNVWTVVSDTGRRINLIGADMDQFQKKGLRVVSAIAKTRLDNGDYVILRSNHSVLNPSSKFTLLSEYQTRENGLMIDSVAKKHQVTPNVYGTQTFYLSDKHTIGLLTKSCLQTFPLEPVRDGDVDVLPIFDITASTNWNPSDHQDEASDTIYPIQATLEYEGQLAPPKGAAAAQASVSVRPDPPEEDHYGFNSTYRKDNTEPYYFDASDDISDRNVKGKAFHLDIKKLQYLRDPSVDAFLGTMETRELAGYNQPFDSLAYAFRAIAQLQVHGDMPFVHDDDTFHDAWEDVDNPVSDTKPITHNWWDIISYFTSTVQRSTDTVANLHAIRPEDTEWDSLRPYFAWMPVRVIKKTLENTTHLARNVITFPMRRHVSARYPHFHQRRLHEGAATDTFFANCAAYGGSTCAQVFWGTQSHCINVYGMKTESEMPDVYADFLRTEGFPSFLRRDNSKVQKGTKVQAMNRTYLIRDEFTEPHHPQQNPAELRAVKWIKQHVDVLLDRTGAPPKLWLKAAEYLADIHNLCADETLGWKVPYTKRHGDVKDISPFLHFTFYEKVLHKSLEPTFPMTKEAPGYWVGVSKACGDHLTFDILDDEREDIIPRSVVRSAIDPQTPNKRVTWDPNLDPDCNHTTDETTRLQFADHRLPQRRAVAQARRSLKKKQRRRARRRPTTDPEITPSPDVPPTDIQRKERGVTEPDASKIAESDLSTAVPNPVLSNPTHTIQAPVHMPTTIKPDPKAQILQHSSPQTEITTTTPCSKEPEGTQNHQNMKEKGELVSEAQPKKKNVQAKRESEEHLTNQSENIEVRKSGRTRKPRSILTMIAMGIMMATSRLAFVSTYETNDDGTTETTTTKDKLEEIKKIGILTPRENAQLEYLQTLDSVSEPDHEWTPLNVSKHLISSRDRNDVHLKVKVEYSNGETAWQRGDAVRLQDPEALVLYALEHKLTDNEFFRWTKSYMTSTHGLSALLSKGTKTKKGTKLKGKNATKYKFGEIVPSNVRHALALDRMNGTTEWQSSMQAEIDGLNEFQTFRVLEDDEILDSDYQRIPYHLIFDVKFDGRKKSRLVAGGNWTDPPRDDVYSGVVAMDTVRLAFVVGQAQNLKCCAGDISSAFLYGKTQEKVYVIAGPEFGEHEGKRLLIDKGLYGLITSAARFHEHCSATLRKMGFRPSTYDHDLWIRKCGYHYEMVACYVDDVLAWGKDPMSILKEFQSVYMMKGVGAPDYYLGGDVIDLDQNWNLMNVTTALSGETYIKNAIEKAERMMHKTFAKEWTPMREDLHPELDDSPLLDGEHASKYRSLIGAANWLVTLGRFDIHYALTALSRFNMAPRQNHLIAIMRVFGYLKRFPKGKIPIDHTSPDLRHLNSNSSVIPPERWKEFYPDAVEDKPHKYPDPLCPEMQLTAYVDADHAHDQLTRRSVTGIIVFLNNTPIRWVSKRQPTVETSTYGSELVALRIAVELIIELRYALRCLGVHVAKPAQIFGDNKAVALAGIPSSMLKKKHNACAYHRVREAFAAGVASISHIDTSLNYADVLTKPLGRQKFHHFIQPLLFRTPFQQFTFASALQNSTLLVKSE